LQKEEIELQTQYQRALKHEEELWHLKSHILWLKVGDKNTKKIHNQAKAKQSKNNVSSITTEYGSIVIDFVGTKAAAVTLLPYILSKKR